MICPMRFMESKFVDTNESIKKHECMGTLCAWWDKDTDRCGIMDIAASLDIIQMIVFKDRKIDWI